MWAVSLKTGQRLFGEATKISTPACGAVLPKAERQDSGSW